MQVTGEMFGHGSFPERTQAMRGTQKDKHIVILETLTINCYYN